MVSADASYVEVHKIYVVFVAPCSRACCVRVPDNLILLRSLLPRVAAYVTRPNEFCITFIIVLLISCVLLAAGV